MARKPYDYPFYARHPKDMFADPRFSRLPKIYGCVWGALLDVMWAEGHETHLVDDDKKICLWLNIDMDLWINCKIHFIESGLLTVDKHMKRIYSKRLETEFKIIQQKCDQQAANRRSGYQKHKPQDCFGANEG